MADDERKDKFFRDLFGFRVANFPNNGLPKAVDVMRVFFFFVNELNQSLVVSARRTARVLRSCWLDHNLPTLNEAGCSSKIKRLYNEYDSLRKSRRRKGNTFEARLSIYMKELSEVFDIGKPLKPRPARKEKRKSASLANERQRKVRRTTTVPTKHNDEDYESDDSVKYEDTDSKDPDFENSDSGDETDTEISKLIDLSFLQNLDRGKVSQNDAFRIVKSLVTGLGLDIKSMKCSRSSLFRKRKIMREAEAEKIRAAFNPSVPLTVHWDGIKVKSLTARRLVERLPVHVTGKNVDQMLGARIIVNGTGMSQANEVTDALKDWKCVDQVAALCSDTTASNTGQNKGAAIFIEKTLKKKLLYLACRHHVLEIIPKHLFDKMIEASSSPDLGTLCKQFQMEWPSMNHSAFLSATEDPLLETYLSVEKKETLLKFATDTLLKEQIRDDYQYLLELTIIFLGGIPPKGIVFKPPMALSSARFMGRIIYCLSIYMFALTGEFQVSDEKLSNLRDLNLFLVTTYLEPWYTATNPVSAPLTDLNLLNSILEYSSVSQEVSQLALEAFKKHLWYLSEHCVALAFFDDRVDDQTKRLMVSKLETKGEKIVQKSYFPGKKFNFKSLKNVTLPFFVSSNTIDFFLMLNIRTDFLKEDPSTWATNESFSQGLSIVKSLQVVNDVAERGVALVKDYNCHLTTEENDFQNLLLMVKKLRNEDGQQSLHI